MAKVIHVHIFSRPRGERKDYYFSSITAVYSVLTAEDIGAKKVLSASLRSERRRLYRHKEGYYQAVNSYRKQQKEDGAILKAPSTNEIGCI